MTRYTVKSLVIIAPNEVLESIDQMAGVLGYNAGFSVPLNATGAGDATHKALHATTTRDFLWIVTGNPESPPTIPEEPTPLTLDQIESDPDAVEAYNTAAIEYQNALTEAESINADRVIYDAYMATLLQATDQATIDALRAQMIVSADILVNDVLLYGRSHLDYIAGQNNLQVIEEELI